MEFGQTLSAYSSGAPDVRSAAQKTLQEQARKGRLTSAEVAALLQAMTRPLAPPEHDWQDPASSLAWIARDSIYAAQASAPPAEVVAEVFARATPKSREAILQVIAAVSSPDYARVYARAVAGNLTAGAFPFSDGLAFIQTPAAKQHSPKSPPGATAETAAILFPAVLDAVRFESLRQHIYLMLLEFLAAKLVNIETIRPHEPVFLKSLNESCTNALALQSENRTGHFNWKYEGPYASVRELSALLLDLAGRWKTPPVAAALAQTRPFSDPWLRMFVATSRLHHGLSVAPSELDEIARSPRERYCLRRQIEEGRLQTPLPTSCADQARIAEGHMVDWLCFGTELGREPDEIELVHVESRKRGGIFRRKTLDYFFFRFRVTEEHWSNDKGWCVGMAGGYETTLGGTTDHDGGTFSKFTPWDQQPLAAHVADYLK